MNAADEPTDHDVTGHQRSLSGRALAIIGAAAVILLVIGIAIGRATVDDGDDVGPPAASPQDHANDADAGTDGCGTGCNVGTDLPAVKSTSGATYRFTVGGQRYTDTQGNTWEQALCTGGNSYVSPNPINGTDDDILFQARQFEPRCTFDVEDGQYDVTLGWAETYRDSPGYRVFSVSMEGRTVDTIDVGKAAGLNRTYLRTFSVAVTDGSLDIAAEEVENRPMLALVMALRTGDAAPGSGGGSTEPNDAPDDGAPREPGVLAVGPGQQYSSLQAALDAARPGDTVQLATAGEHAGPAASARDGTAEKPITITAVAGARLECGSPEEGEVARCFELGHSYYSFDGFSIEGGSSNLYMVGASAGTFVHDVKVRNSTFRGARGGGTGECIRVKYQAYNVEIAHNDIADCGLGKCCDGSKNGEAVYIGTAPEQLEEKNPSSEPDRTHDVWVHHNVMRPRNECVDIKEAAHDNLVEFNTCSGQQDSDAAGMGSRGGRVGEGNIFRFNVITDTVGACVRFGGDDEPDGSGNSFYGNLCRNIAGEYAVNQQVEPQGAVCGNTFEGGGPRKKISRTDGVDPAAPCPADVPMDGAAHPGAG